MPWISAAVAVGGSLLASSMQSDASESAAQTQADSSRQSAAVQKQMFDTLNQQQAPYRQAGYSSLDEILKGFGMAPTGAGGSATGMTAAAAGAPSRASFTTPGGVPPMHWGGGTFERMDERTGQPVYVVKDLNDPGAASYETLGPAVAGGGFDQAGYDAANAKYLSEVNAGGGAQAGGVVPSGFFSKQFGPADLYSNLAPNYNFMLGQGLGAVKNAGNLQTGLVSGNTLKGVNDYAQNYASNAYQQAYNNFTSNQGNIFNRLSSIAGLGQTAVGQTGSNAVQSGANIGSSLQNAGAAQAAGTIGSANALAAGGNNALGWYQLSKIMNGGSPVTGGANVTSGSDGIFTGFE